MTTQSGSSPHQSGLRAYLLMLLLACSICGASTACAACALPQAAGLPEAAELNASTTRAPTVAPIATDSPAAYPRVVDLDTSALRSFHPGQDETVCIAFSASGSGLARVRLVDGNQPGIILRTLCDWTPYQASGHTLTWDGRDAHGDYVNPRRVSLVVALTPPRQGLSAEVRQTLSALPYPEEKHFQHDATACADLDPEFIQPSDGQTVSGDVTVRANLGQHHGMPDDEEYHVVIYLDGNTIWDGRMFGAELNYDWPTTTTPNGAHRLAVTYNDLHDHAGSHWADILVRND